MNSLKLRVFNSQIIIVYKRSSDANYLPYIPVALGRIYHVF